METSNTGLDGKVDMHDKKLSRLEATVLYIYVFMKRQWVSTPGKGKGKEKMVVEDEVDKDVLVTTESSIHADSPFDDPVPILALLQHPLSTIDWPSVFLLDIYDSQRIARGLRDPNTIPGMPVHRRLIKDIEARVLITHVIPEKENSALWLREQYDVAHIEGVCQCVYRVSFLPPPTYSKFYAMTLFLSVLLGF